MSTSLFPPAQIQHCEVIPGRLLHVRLETHPSTSQPNVDIVVCYQHAWSLPKQCTDKAKHRETVLSKRAELWTRLSTLLAALPIRNQLLLLGDLNILSINGCQLGLGAGLLKEGCFRRTQLRQLTLDRRKRNTRTVPFFSRPAVTGGSFSRARLVADALRPATALHRLQGVAKQLHGSESFFSTQVV